MRYEDIPEQYLANMHSILGDEFEEFIKIYDFPPARGLCFNSRKTRKETIEKLVSLWNLESVPWCPCGWYYDETIRPGLSPYHDAGVFYIQEPSAMMVAQIADIAGSDLVLDLSAAPGGKSVQAAAQAKLLISNEPVPKRARVLSSNIERMGFDNCIVTSAWPDKLSDALRGWFDIVLVDAPCSGEGMMRKDESIATNWSEDYIRLCAGRQVRILKEAALMVRPGGKLVYSTCTFEIEENEGMIESFLANHPEFLLERQLRIWPHRQRGEGQFVAVLKKDGNARSEKKDIGAITRYMRQKRIHVLRSGIEPLKKPSGHRDKNLFIPTHAEAKTRVFSLDNGTKINFLSEEIALRYLCGEGIDLNKLDKSDFVLYHNTEGFATVYYDGYPLGNARISKTTLKNLYPKGLRRVRNFHER